MARSDREKGGTTASLLERLLSDADFRSRFRVDPRGALEDAGMGAMAEQLSELSDPMQTLQPRESRSSLAGAGMAAAIEGFALLGPGLHLVDSAQAAGPPASGQGGGQALNDAVSPPPAPADGSADDSDLVDPSAPAPTDPNNPPPAPADGSADDSDLVDPTAPAPTDPNNPPPAPADDSADGSDSEDSGDSADSSDEDSDSGGDDGEDNEEEGAGWDAIDEQTNNPESSDSGSSSDDSGSSSSDGGDSSDSGSDGSDSGSSSGDSGSDNADDADSGAGNAASGSGAPVDYPGDDAKPAQVAAWMGQEAQRRGLPRELPIMAALTESGMRNLDHGDRDSLGFFQMRESVWNGGPYAGYATDPKRQLDWFLDQAQAVGKQRQARGLSTTDPRQYGEWIADVERPAEQYRGRYQGHLAEARSLLDQSDTSANGNGANQGVDQLADAVDAPAPGRQAVAALGLARKQLGTPYLWGGSSPKTGFDCSGLMQWAYAKAGIPIPRVTYDQIDAPGAQKIPRNKLLPGDLVFFKNASGDVHHVGMSLGGDKFIQAPHTGDVVKISSLKEPYYAREFTGGRRFVPAVAGGNHPAVAALVDAGAKVDAQGAARANAGEIDAQAVKVAMAALEQDSQEVIRPGSLLHQLLTRQESGKGNDAQFLPAISVQP